MHPRPILSACRRSVVALLPLLALLALPASAGADAPKVVQTSPANGDLAVDPSITELRVVFDQPMDRRAGHSFVGGGETFPEIVGQPRWLDEKTIVLPIRLAAGRGYQLSINSEQFQGFRNAAGEPAEPYPLAFTTADDKPLSPELNAAAIQQVRDALRDRYSYRDVHRADWDALFTAADAELKSAASRAAFGQRLARLLAEAGDVHISVGVGPQRFWTHQPKFAPNFNGRLIPQVVPNFKKHSESLYSGRFDDRVGYIMIASLEAARGADAAAITDVLGGMADARALILDLRPNGGGDERIAQPVAGLFIEKPVIYAQRQTIDPARPDGFSEPVKTMLNPTPLGVGPRLRQPVAVLMGPNNMSSAEGFLLMMRQVPQAKLIGGRSYGSSGNPQPIELANGVTVYLPSWKAMDAAGVVFEGKGIEPDIEVAATPEQLQSRDPVLERGLAWLRANGSEGRP